jgi:hypothetical protein
MPDPPLFVLSIEGLGLILEDTHDGVWLEFRIAINDELEARRRELFATRFPARIAQYSPLIDGLLSYFVRFALGLRREHC